MTVLLIMKGHVVQQSCVFNVSGQQRHSVAQSSMLHQALITQTTLCRRINSLLVSFFSLDLLTVRKIAGLRFLKKFFPSLRVVYFDDSSVNANHMEPSLVAVSLNNSLTIVTLKGITPTMETIKHKERKHQ